MPPSNFSDDERLDAEMLAEELGATPAPIKPEEGIADMQKRLRLLRARRKEIERSEHLDEDYKITRLLEFDREIANANARLREYQTQLKGRN